MGTPLSNTAIASAPTCTVRDPRIATALATVPRESFPPVVGTWREWTRDALIRILEDLALRPRSRVLVVDPVSGYLPALLARLVEQVVVVCPAPSRAGLLAEQLGNEAVTNVHLSSFLEPRTASGNTRFDAILVAQPHPKGLPQELSSALSNQGRAIVPLDTASPPRHILRVLCSEEGLLFEEELDLTHYLPLLGDMLVDHGFVMRAEVADALRAAKKHGRMLGQELLHRGSVREDDLYRVLAEQHQMTFTDTASVLPRLDRQLLHSLPRKYLDHYRFVPVCIVKGRTTVVTTSLDLPLWDLRGVFEGTEVIAELTTPTDLQRIWTAIELGFVTEQVARSAPTSKPEESTRPVLEDSRAAGLFDAMLLDAVAERASDIHLENYHHGARLRFRIDGSLHDIGRYQLTAADLSSVVNVIKIAGDIDIAERRMPQSGRVHRRVGNHVLDLRVQTQPTLHLENVVIRILPQDRRPPTIEELGFKPSLADRYRRLLNEPHGLVLVVGATGSGKSTTLYAGLQMLAKDATRKVITIEDPIEFSIAGIQQTQVNQAVGFHFAQAMRAFVREDPDVILVGEVRDTETALETIRAAQTGHLVLATMHCNDTVDAVQRLADLGMHPNSIASELTAVMAQRLARRICNGCKVAAEPDAEVAAELFPNGIPADFRCFVGKGCPRCNDTGTRGRIAVVELLTIDAEMRRAISRRVVLDDLRTMAHKMGYVSLRDSALELVQSGDISMRELLDILSAEQMRPVV
ncbi:MAG: Flp pilus assembly complex ATPase component TadA [Planctomycetes bacterium]|jgi:type IV pilus assembly protein PilB|nr:Flp pilus assembly complex ATPase component TadA [Planctomycetota bacterium]MCC7066500.1 Flp pilus assembly complex ATPase component TadA [Planctomycetota bacterium]